MKKVIKKVASWLGKFRGKKARKPTLTEAAKSANSVEARKQHPASQRSRHESETSRQQRKPQQHRGTERTAASARDQARTARPMQKYARAEQGSHKPRARDRHPKFAPETETPKTIADSWEISAFNVAPQHGKTRFHDLNLPKEIMHAIADLGFQYCTPIQAGVLPKSLEGQDIVGQAQTGTGKSAAFLITILKHLLQNTASAQRRKATPRALILAPTRELVMQIEKDAKALSKYLSCGIVSVFGGMHYEKQKRWLDTFVDIVVATPGRLIDFKSQNLVHLNHVEILVIDEADRMLDMGFIPDIRNIVHSTPTKDKRQTLFFSATVTQDVMRLAGHWTRNEHKEAIEPERIAVDTVDQKIYIATTDEKFLLLYNMIAQQNLERVIVFANRRDETQKLYEGLMSRGISCGLLSGDVDQRKRIRTLEDLRLGAIRVLVATDVVARGLHIEGVSHVVNYNLPPDPEDYVHRIGRTGRAGATGISVSFACEEDGAQIPVIEKFIGRKLESIYPPDEWLTPIPEPTVEIPKIPLLDKKRFEDRKHRHRGSRRGDKGNRPSRHKRRPGHNASGEAGT